MSVAEAQYILIYSNTWSADKSGKNFMVKQNKISSTSQECQLDFRHLD